MEVDFHQALSSLNFGLNQIDPAFVQVCFFLILFILVKKILIILIFVFVLIN